MAEVIGLGQNDDIGVLLDEISCTFYSLDKADVVDAT